jgi:hypothetical protein
VNNLEDRLRERFADAPVPELCAPSDLLLRVRAAHRRRRALPLIGGACVAATGSAAFLLLMSGSSPSQSLTPAAPTSSPAVAASQEPCTADSLLATGGPRSIVHFRWPSGAKGVILRFAPANCPAELMLSTATVAEEDRAAAEARWGNNVVLLPFDPRVATRVPTG